MQPADFEERTVDIDGSRYAQNHCEPAMAAVLSWYGVLIDIDDRRKAEEALRESEYKLRQIIETVPGLLWSMGPDGELTQINQRVLDYSGMRFEDSTSWLSQIPPSG